MRHCCSGCREVFPAVRAVAEVLLPIDSRAVRMELEIRRFKMQKCCKVCGKKVSGVNTYCNACLNDPTSLKQVMALSDRNLWHQERLAEIRCLSCSGLLLRLQGLRYCLRFCRKHSRTTASGQLRASASSMLHIDIEERLGIGLVFTLKGELSGAHAFELVARWKEVRRNCHGKVCVVDLSAVGEMDDAGEGAICALAHDGVRFLARGPMLGPVIDVVCKASVEASQAGCAGFRSMVFNN